VSELTRDDVTRLTGSSPSLPSDWGRFTPGTLFAGRFRIVAPLGGTIDDEGRARLRAAAEATAAPRLRIVIEAAAKETPEDELRHRLAASYRLVRSSLPKKAQAGLKPFE